MMNRTLILVWRKTFCCLLYPPAHRCDNFFLTNVLLTFCLQSWSVIPSLWHIYSMITHSIQLYETCFEIQSQNARSDDEINANGTEDDKNFSIAIKLFADDEVT